MRRLMSSRSVAASTTSPHSAIAATPDAYASGLLRTLLETILGFAACSLFGVAIGVVYKDQLIFSKGYGVR